MGWGLEGACRVKGRGWMSWLGGRRGTVELRKSGVKQWDPNQAAFLAERAEVDQLARELVKESSPIPSQNNAGRCRGLTHRDRSRRRPILPKQQLQPLELGINRQRSAQAIIASSPEW